jgi:DNA polymerase III subunit delta'
MGFAEVIGHTKQLDSLRAALANQRLHHAYLFVGPDGVGKRTIAMALAKAIHCSELTGDYCGRCAQCASIIDSNHADVRVVQPLAGKKEISIHQVREIERELRFRSFGGKRKIAIIDPAAAMNPSAQNALLKTLEEPPENSLILLITPNAGGLLPTLRSRCLRLSFAPLARQDVAGFLRATTQNSAAKDTEFLAAISMGSIGVAASLDRAALVEKRQAWIGILSALHDGDYQGAMAAAEALATSREDALEFLKWAESWYRDVLVHGVTQKSDEIVNLDMMAQIEQSAVVCGAERALAALAGVTGAAAGIQRNLNRRMVLEKLLIGVVEGR